MQQPAPADELTDERLENLVLNVVRQISKQLEPSGITIKLDDVECTNHVSEQRHD
jgi:hypothetical protein